MDSRFLPHSEPDELSHGRHTDRYVIIDGMADMFALATADTSLSEYLKAQGRKIHRQGIHWALRDAGMTPLPGRAQSLRHLRHTESNIRHPVNRPQRVSRTGGNAGKIVTQKAGRLVCKNHRGAVTGMTNNRARIAGLDTVATFRATIQKHDFFYGPRRPKPIRPQYRSRRLRHSIDVLGKLLCRLGDGHHGVFQKIPPAI